VRKGEREMIKSYAVVFLNEKTWKTKMDIFSEISTGAARHAFRECYRHGNYRVLSIVEIPEKQD